MVGAVSAMDTARKTRRRKRTLLDGTAVKGVVLPPLLAPRLAAVAAAAQETLRSPTVYQGPSTARVPASAIGGNPTAAEAPAGAFLFAPWTARERKPDAATNALPPIHASSKRRAQRKQRTESAQNSDNESVDDGEATPPPQSPAPPPSLAPPLKNKATFTQVTMKPLNKPGRGGEIANGALLQVVGQHVATGSRCGLSCPSHQQRFDLNTSASRTELRQPSPAVRLHPFGFAD
jgi:hypothetical protein